MPDNHPDHIAPPLSTSDRSNKSNRHSLNLPKTPLSATGPGRLSVGSTIRRRPHGLNTVTTSKYVTLVPGAEPGLNPENTEINLHALCGITVVDFSEDQITQRELDNASLVEFLEEERPAWSKVRWMNVNGLSWDCIRAIAKKWNLHTLGLWLKSI